MTANEQEFSRSNTRFRHLPPTAIEIEWQDLSSGFLSLLHPELSLQEFRLAIQEEFGSPACELVSSGRSALVVILVSLKRLSARSKVIIPAYSCSTVVQSVFEAGLIPVFCDQSLKNLDLDRDHLHQLLDDEVLAVIPTHLYGLAQDVSDLVELGRDHGFFVIEDAAQSFGARFGDRYVGTLGDVGFFSLGRGKCVPSGHGGVILAGDRCAEAVSNTVNKIVNDGYQLDMGSLAAYLGYAIATRPFGWWFIDRSPLNPADQGMDVETLPGIKLQGMSGVQAGIASSIFQRLQKINTLRRAVAHRVINMLSEFSFIQFPEIPSQAEPVFLRLPFLVDQRKTGKRLFKSLRMHGIGISKSYFRTLPDLYSSQIESQTHDYPTARHIADCLYTLPTHTYINDEDIENILSAFDNLPVSRE
jgi:dTDP-4-amino-4,6-dideoxygalactose transaminase